MAGERTMPGHKSQNKNPSSTSAIAKHGAAGHFIREPYNAACWVLARIKLGCSRRDEHHFNASASCRSLGTLPFAVQTVAV